MQQVAPPPASSKNTKHFFFIRTYTRIRDWFIIKTRAVQTSLKINQRIYEYSYKCAQWIYLFVYVWKVQKKSKMFFNIPRNPTNYLCKRWIKLCINSNVCVFYVKLEIILCCFWWIETLAVDWCGLRQRRACDHLLVSLFFRIWIFVWRYNLHAHHICVVYYTYISYTLWILRNNCAKNISVCLQKKKQNIIWW